ATVTRTSPPLSRSRERVALSAVEGPGEGLFAPSSLFSHRSSDDSQIGWTGHKIDPPSSGSLALATLSRFPSQGSASRLARNHRHNSLAIGKHVAVGHPQHAPSQ